MLQALRWRSRRDFSVAARHFCLHCTGRRAKTHAWFFARTSTLGSFSTISKIKAWRSTLLKIYLFLWALCWWQGGTWIRILKDKGRRIKPWKRLIIYLREHLRVFLFVLHKIGIIKTEGWLQRKKSYNFYFELEKWHFYKKNIFEKCHLFLKFYCINDKRWYNNVRRCAVCFIEKSKKIF